LAELAISKRIEKILKNYKEELLNEEVRKIIACHFGSFSQDFVYSFCENLEDLLISIGDDRLVIKRIFSILIEGLQNIRLHGKRDEENQQSGFLIIASDEASYKIVMANLIASEDSQKLQEYLARINEYSQDELKKTYLGILQREFMSNKGGAGLGFITTRLKSKNKLSYRMFPMSDDKFLFSFEIIISRS
jgi:hypothetical protein